MITSTPPPSTAHPSVSDLRRNAERQSREQTSVTRVLAIFGYSLLAAIILLAALASYGGYILYSQLQDQSATIAQLESRVQRENGEIKTLLQGTQEELASTKRTIVQQQTALTRQQEQLTRLDAANRSRAREISDLRSRLR